ncbi:MAG: helix-hairpin-helix domain-containing protein, partial [Ignavibacteria bacterium]|nr:helix-hairpin-helix domain-containing protein [Ignavibacteria bacterium]
MRILFLILLSFSFCLAQQPDTTIAPIIEDDEDILEQTVQDAEDTQVYEIIEYLKENPLNLNKARTEELMKIPGITLGIANEIIEYRNTFGGFISVTELLSIKGIDKELYGRIKPYFIVTDIKQAEFNSETNTWERVERQNFLQKLNLNYRTRTIRDLQTRKGFATGKFYNSPFKLYQRLKLNYDRTFFINLISEKDAGEKNLTDFISGNFAIKELSFIKSFVIGDYVLEFGQGLSLWRSIGFSKSSDAIFSIKKIGNGVIPYTSTDENQFFRGSAGTIKFSNFSLSAFYSTNTFDASIDSLTQLITSRTLDGFHRTDNELKKKNSSKEILLGGRVQVDIDKNLSLALMHYNSRFENAFQKKSAYSISGDKFSYSSLDFSYRFERISLFGEVVRSSENVFASIIGLQTYLTSSID